MTQAMMIMPQSITSAKAGKTNGSAGKANSAMETLPLENPSFGALLLGFQESQALEGDQGESLAQLLDSLQQFILNLPMEEQGGQDLEAKSENEQHPLAHLIGDIEQMDQMIEYLQRLLQLQEQAIEGDHTSIQQIATLLLQLPIQSVQQVDKHGQLFAMQPEQQGEIPSTMQALKHWHELLSLLQQSHQQNNQQRPEQPMIQPSYQQAATQLLGLIEQLVRRFQQEPQQLGQMMREMDKQVGASLQLVHEAEASAKRMPTPSFLPLSLLNRADQGKGIGQHTVMTESQAHAIHHKQETSPSDLLGRVVSVDSAQQQQTAMKMNEPSAPIMRMQHMIDDLQHLLKAQMQRGKDGDTSHFRVQIHPQHLGHLDIKVQSIDGKIHAQLMASSAMAKDALELSIGQLRTTLVQQGIQVERIEVTQQHSANQSLMEHRNSQQQGQQTFQQQNGQLKKHTPYEPEEWLDDSFAIDNHGYPDDVDYGSKINFTA